MWLSYFVWHCCLEFLFNIMIHNFPGTFIRGIENLVSFNSKPSQGTYFKMRKGLDWTDNLNDAISRLLCGIYLPIGLCLLFGVFIKLQKPMQNGSTYYQYAIKNRGLKTFHNYCFKGRSRLNEKLSSNWSSLLVLLAHSLLVPVLCMFAWVRV